MSAIPKHDLVHEFPQFRDKIHQLKMSNAHFAKLFMRCTASRPARSIPRTTIWKTARKNVCT